MKDNILHWETFNKNFKDIFRFDFENLMNILERSIPPEKWRNLKGWEEYEDSEILKKINPHAFNFLENNIYIITEASYNKNFGPFSLKATELKEFVNNHLDNYKECFFNGNVLIIDAEKKNVLAFHDEGIFAWVHKEEGAHSQWESLDK